MTKGRPDCPRPTLAAGSLKKQKDFDFLHEDIFQPQPNERRPHPRRTSSRTSRFLPRRRRRLGLGRDLHACPDSTLNIIWNEIKYSAPWSRTTTRRCPRALHRVAAQPGVHEPAENAAHAIPERARSSSPPSHDATGTVAHPRERQRVGIPAENPRPIFEPSSPPSPSAKGTGLVVHRLRHHRQAPRHHRWPARWAGRGRPPSPAGREHRRRGGCCDDVVN